VAVRASDEDRERVVDILREATSRGYLTLAEFEDRLGSTLAARHLDQLDPLLSDLPGTPRPSAGWSVPTSASASTTNGAPVATVAGGAPVYRARTFLAGLPPVARVVLCVLMVGLVASALVQVLTSGIWVVALIVFLCVRRGHHRRRVVV
jgi:hypothetical protein